MGLVVGFLGFFIIYNGAASNILWHCSYFCPWLDVAILASILYCGSCRGYHHSTLNLPYILCSLLHFNDIIDGKVYLKTTSHNTLRIVEEWCEEAKVNKIFRIDFMFKYKEHSLPLKGKSYETYKLANWLAVEAKDGFTRDVISNIHTDVRTIQWEMIGWKIMGTL